MQHIITLLTDFGIRDTYVGQLKASILGVCRACHLVDLTHQVGPQNVLQGALLLADAAFQFPKGTIHVAVVDPGVGTERRIVAAEFDGQTFVLPDNGLLTYVLESRDCTKAVVLDNPEYWRSPVSNTFHGRDIMGPVAGHLAAGCLLTRLGTPTQSLQRVDFATQAALQEEPHSAKSLQARVLHIDHYGNVILEFGPQTPAAEQYRVGDSDQLVVKVSTYGRADDGELVLLRGSSGRWELAKVGGSAAKQVHVRLGQTLAFRDE